MGGAYGHMNHPFDLTAINTGQDLIDFFYNALESIEGNPAALKLDGVNASIKVVGGSVGGKQFAGDRGSSYEIDVSGITKARVAERWVDNPTHGMIGSYRKVLDIFNESIPRIKSELQQLGMWNNPSRYFNIEFVEVDEEAKSTNVVEYDRSYIAIHGLAQFYEKKTKIRPDKRGRSGFDTVPRLGLPRPILLDDDNEPVIDPRTGKPKLVSDKGTAIPYDKDALERLVQIMRPIGERHGFDIYSTIPTKYKNDVQTKAVHDEFERVLRTPFRLCIDDSDCPVELSLRDWLARAKNPKRNPKGVSDVWIKTKSGALKKVEPLNKDIYMYASNDENKLADLIDDRYFLRDAGGELTRELDPAQFVRHGGEPMPAIRPMIDAIVFWEAIKNLGHVVKNSLTSDKFGHVEDQEGIVIRDKQFGSALVKDPDSGKEFEMPLDVKITGEFITQGLDTPFGKVNEATETLLTEGLVDLIRAGMGYLPDWAQTAAMIVDPSGMTAWPDVEDAYDAFSADANTTNGVALLVSLAFAIPVVGGRFKIAKAGVKGAKALGGTAKLAKMAEKMPGLIPALGKANKLAAGARGAAGMYSLVRGVSSILPSGQSIAQGLARSAAVPLKVRSASAAADQETKEKELDSAKEAGKTIALFPGSFKPPHRGHISTLTQLAMDPAISLVRILVSNPQGKYTMREIVPGVTLDAAATATIWKKIISNLGLPEGKIEVEVSGENSSFLSALKYVEDPPPSKGGQGAPVGATIVFGCGDKDDASGTSDAKRFDAVDSIISSGRVRPDLKLAKRACKLNDTHSDKYMTLLDRKSNRRIRDGVPNRTSEGDPSEDFHASDFRYFLKLYMDSAIGPHSKRVIRALLKDFVPEPKEDNINSIVDTLSNVNNTSTDKEEIVTESKKKLTMHSLFSLVEEVLTEISGMAGGAVAGYAGPVYKRDDKKKKKKKEKDEANVYKLENLEDTITNILETEY